MGGDIQVTSTVGAGSIFRVKMLLSESPSDANCARSMPRSSAITPAQDDPHYR